MSVSEPGCPDEDRSRGVDLRAGVAYLRRLARAHAAGEIATDAFRRKRRAYIEACAAGLAPQWDDVTVPRAMLPALAVGQAATGQPPGQVRSAGNGWRRWRRLLGIALSVALLVILATD